MTINLQEIRTAVVDYLDKMVTLTVSDFDPAEGNIINDNESFTFSVEVKNSDSRNGGIPLTDVVWHIWVENENVAQLIVPNIKPIVAYTSLSTSSDMITPGKLVREMYLFPAKGFGGYLNIGARATIPLEGKTGKSPTGGTTQIKFEIYADVDMEWLFPKDESSIIFTKFLTVSG